MDIPGPPSTKRRLYLRLLRWRIVMRHSAITKLPARVGSLTRGWSALSVGVSLSFGFTMIQVDEYFFANLGWLVATIILACKSIYWIRQGASVRLFVRLLGVGSAICLFALMVTWTSLKRRTRPWSAFSVLLERPGSISARTFPLKVPTYALRAPYTDYVPNPPPEPADTPVRGPLRLRSRITITNSEALVLHNKNTNSTSITVSVYCTNSGDLAAIGTTRSAFIDIVDRELTTTEQNDFADMIAQAKWNPAHVGDEIQPGEKVFFSFPNTDADISKIAARSAEVIAGKAMLYLFVVQKYRDQSMPPNVVNVTEYCGWFSGGSSPESDLQIRHRCGRNRIFQESRK